MFEYGRVFVAGRAGRPYSFCMRHFILPALVLLLGLGCEPAEFSPDTADPVADTGRDDTDPPGPTARGVQIGSEGIVTVCGVREIDGAQTPAGFGDTAAALSAALLGEFSGSLGSSPASLSLTATGFSEISGSDCPTVFAAALSGGLDASPELSGSAQGWALIEPGSTAVFTVWSSDWQGSAAPVFDLADFDTVQVRIDGTVDTMGVDATVSFEGCTGSECSLEDYGNLIAAPL